MKSRYMIMTVSCVALLSGCSWLEDWPPSGKEFTKAPPKPKAQVMQTADSTWLETDKQAMPVQRDQPRERDEVAMRRLESLEREVAQMRSDISMMMPALTRLSQIQGDLQVILQNYQPSGGMPTQTPYNDAHLDVQAMPEYVPPPPPAVSPQGMQQQAPSYYSTSPVTAPVPTPVTTPVHSAQPPVAPVPVYQPAAASAMAVSQVRFGEHGDKTRLVLDTSGSVPFRYDLDNGEQILMVELPGAAWNTTAQSQFANSPLIASYNAIPDGQGGTQLAIQLRRPAQILWAQSIPPAAGKGNRVVIDIAGM
ncbi:MAG: AMIN domain-containing protein [Rhodospirillales bacterium]|nr:AMIN domain-containing protein [Rhodospirillales bacterium]